MPEQKSDFGDRIGKFYTWQACNGGRGKWEKVNKTTSGVLSAAAVLRTSFGSPIIGTLLFKLANSVYTVKSRVYTIYTHIHTHKVLLI